MAEVVLGETEVMPLVGQHSGSSTPYLPRNSAVALGGVKKWEVSEEKIVNLMRLKS